MSMMMTDGLVEMGRDEMSEIQGGVFGVDDLIIIGVCVGVVAITAWWAYDRHKSAQEAVPQEDPNPNFGHHTFTLGK